VQMITWSANLQAAVKSLKQLDATSLQSSLNNRSYMNSLALSATEEQALTTTFLHKKSINKQLEWG
jgi:hypothetical protein